MQGISIAEFARRDGCSDANVHQQGLRTGALKRFPDGSLDPALVGTGWRPANRRIAQVNEGESPAEAAERIVSDGAVLLSIADAERLKENYLGRLRQLEYDVKAAAVVPASVVARMVGEEYARVRTKLMAIPAEQAPRLHRLKTVAEMQDALMALMVEALEGLTRDATVDLDRERAVQPWLPSARGGAAGGAAGQPPAAAAADFEPMGG